MPTATLTSKGQVTIPREVREALGIGTGDRVEFVAEEKGVYRLVAATRDVRHLKGLIDKPPRPVSVENMKRAAARGASR
jgi:antitoxin PrlF